MYLLPRFYLRVLYVLFLDLLIISFLSARDPIYPTLNHQVETSIVVNPTNSDKTISLF